MIKEGLIDEVKLILNKGFKGDEKPLQSIGYKETYNLLKVSLITKIHISKELISAQGNLQNLKGPFSKRY